MRFAGTQGAQGCTLDEDPLKLICNGGNTSLYITWNKPDDSSINVTYFYRTYVTQPTPQQEYLEFTPAVGATSPYSLSIVGLTANTEYTFEMYAFDIDKDSSTCIKTLNAIPVEATDTFTGAEMVGGTSVAFTDASTQPTVPGEPTPFPAVNIGSNFTVTTGTLADVTVGNVAKNDVQTFVNTLPLGETYGGAIVLSSTPSTPATISFNLPCDVNTVLVIARKCITDGRTAQAAAAPPTTCTRGTAAVNLQIPNAGSIYIISYISEQSEQCCIPSPIVNQSYNNNLYTEKGRVERRENRILAGGYYRGPVDSSTLTRIRQGNGVLLHQPGVNGGFRGSL